MYSLSLTLVCSRADAAKGLSYGIFWIVSDSFDLDNHKLVYFNVPCDTHGNITETPAIRLNSKNGKSYNHKAMWDSQVKNNPLHKPYNKKDYNHYPRGQVEILNNKAVIYLNPVITWIPEQLITRMGAQY